MKKIKTLKIWNGRGHGEFTRGHIYVAAYTKKQARELIGLACYPNTTNRDISIKELNDYYSEGCWGNLMAGIVPTEPCVYYASSTFGDIPKRII